MEQRSPEHLPTPIESSPGDQTGKTTESLRFSQHEIVELSRAADRSGNMLHQTTKVVPQAQNIVQLPTPVAQATPQTNSTQDDSGHPSSAADDELIEKEWVDKAKQIVAQTKGDPHGQEKAVSRLQADYLKKRYGKDLGKEAA